MFSLQTSDELGKLQGLRKVPSRGMGVEFPFFRREISYQYGDATGVGRAFKVDVGIACEPDLIENAGAIIPH